MSNDNLDYSFDLNSLRQEGAFNHSVTQLQLCETHVSRIILTGEFAYKIKKSVKLGFIDTSTLQRRRELCELELRLNRRLAPELYLDVVPVVRDDLQRLHIGGVGEVVDYAVRMRQFDRTQELHSLLHRHAVSAAELGVLAELLASFHDQAPVATDAMDYGSAQQTSEIVLSNFQQLLELCGDEQSMSGLSRLSAWTHEQLDQLEPLFDSRKNGGAVRECHGDLHARNVVRWQGRLTPFDCLEFDPQLRWIDVMNDVAFLVMDLVGHRRADLASAFLSHYLETSGDYAGVRLLPFYAVCRAAVRAMVDALGAQHMPAQHGEYQQRMRERVRTALQFIDRPAPLLVIMHGASGSGKTWLSEQLIGLLPALRVRSDVERKRLTGRAVRDTVGQPIDQAWYTPAVSNRTYARLLDCAESCLQGGMSVIVDAAFLQVVDRRLFFDLAVRLNIQFLIVSCSAAPEVLAGRITERKERHADASDATQAVLAQQLRNMQPLADHELPYCVKVDTTNDKEVRTTMEFVRRHAEQSRV